MKFSFNRAPFSLLLLALSLSIFSPVASRAHAQTQQGTPPAQPPSAPATPPRGDETQQPLQQERNTQPSAPAPQERNAQPPLAAPRATPALATSPQAHVPRERREQAYAKLLEGQRYLMAGRFGGLTREALARAQEAFQQAATLDPTLAEARTAQAEIYFFFLNELDRAESEARAATQIDRNNLGARRLLSRIYTLRSGLSENNVARAVADRAIAELREVTRLYPNDAEAWALLGELYQATGRDNEAIEAFTRWAAAPPALDPRFYQVVTQGRELTQASAAARLAEVLLRAGRRAEALAAIRRALSLEPDNREYLELLERALTASGGDGQAAIAELQRIVASDPTNVGAISLLARAQARAGRMDEAVQTLREAIARGGREQGSLREELAQVYAEAFRYNDAIAVYEEIFRERNLGATPVASPEDRRFVTLLLGRIVSLHRQAGQGPQALATIERMRSLLGPNDPTADLQSILVLRELGRREEALQAAQAARLRHPEQPVFARLEATALAGLGRVDEGVAILRGRLQGNADDYEEYLNIASVYLQAGRGSDAVEAARKALELATPAQPQRETGALLMLASAQERAGDPRGAEETLRRVLAREPNNATALNNLGYFLVERNERLPEALEMIQRAVRAEPTNASYLDSLGWAYYKLERLEEAERYLAEAAQRNPHSATIQEHLGDVYHRRGKREQARTAWQRALTLSIEAGDTARIRAKLNNNSRQ